MPKRTLSGQVIALGESGKMSAGEKKTKAKLARHVENIQAAFERREKIGSELTAAQKAFLEEVAFRDLLWYKYGYHGHGERAPSPAAMDNAQRQAKEAALSRLRSELSDLALLTEVSAPNLEDVRRALPKGGREVRLRPWITKLDVLEVLDIEDMCKIVGFAVEVFGEDYAKALIHAIESYGRTKKKTQRTDSEPTVQ